MKKLFLVLVAAALCFGATSCKKTCTCEGNYKVEVEGMDPIETKVGPFDAGKMSTSDCESYNWDYSVPEGAEFTFKCVSE